MDERRLSYPSLLLEGSREDLDVALAFLFEADCLGILEMEPDGTSVSSAPPPPKPGEPEAPVGSNAAGNRRIRQRAYFPPGRDLASVTRRLARQVPGVRCGPIEEVQDEDWALLWKQGFRGFEAGNGFYVLPSWESPPVTERIVLRIDPERAFGTGTHETTRLCLELIEEHARPGASAIDVGTGTGILAMVAASLGCRPVVAIEYDPDAAACARSNLARNGLADKVQVVTSSLTDVRPLPADIVVANLNQPILSQELPRFASWVRREGVLILSGVLLGELDALAAQLPLCLRLLAIRSSGEWAALSARREK